MKASLKSGLTLAVAVFMGCAYGCSSDDGDDTNNTGGSTNDVGGKAGTAGKSSTTAPKGGAVGSGGAARAGAGGTALSSVAGQSSASGGAIVTGGTSSTSSVARGGASTGGTTSSTGGISTSTGGRSVAGSAGNFTSAGQSAAGRGGAAGSAGMAPTGGVAGSSGAGASHAAGSSALPSLGGSSTGTAGRAGTAGSPGAAGVAMGTGGNSQFGGMPGTAGTAGTQSILGIAETQILQLTSAACLACAKENCNSTESSSGADVISATPGSNSCDSFGAADQALCVSTLACLIQTNCTERDTVGGCFCGTASGTACASTPNGSCLNQEVAGLKTTNDAVGYSFAISNFSLETLPGGSANKLVQCMIDNCTGEMSISHDCAAYINK